jgi:acyl-CoA thioesterase I
MPLGLFLRPGVRLIAAATVSWLALVPVRAETPGSALTRVTFTTPSAPATRPGLPECVVTSDKARFDYPLTRVARHIANGLPIKIIALGSSSTYGVGASTSAASYPSQLALELTRRLPGHQITVLNRGVNGDEAADMLARLETDVIAENPDLILWQVGTNSVLRDHPLQPGALHEGLSRMKAIGADVVLIDPQFAPKVIAKPKAEDMVLFLVMTSKAEHVALFRRFALMRDWYETEHLPFEAFLARDGLHMNDWSYACLGKWVGAAIAEVSTRPIMTSAVPRPTP